ncbi:hypothetical protein [Stieleria varia]|uniref:Uncharacterized protein n=1 Tax=Stieleria varia TaxID=2528005 RepID=A0A5C6A287_9BACT|nr:hypothetical protein [Stieleria varia]TWT93338.1 hypothetical protein Pla52n_59980 [Stieleria varia]
MADRAEKKRRAREGIARARLMYRRDLQWTIGFPIADFSATPRSRQPDSVHWCCLPKPGSAGAVTPILIDREIIRRSELTVSRLRHQFPNALTELFESPDQWLTRFDDLIANLKCVVHEGAPVSLLRESFEHADSTDKSQRAWLTLRRRHPELERCILAIQMAERMSPQPADSSIIDWIDNSAEGLMRLKVFDGCPASTPSVLPDPLALQLKLVCLSNGFRAPSCVERIANLLLSDGFRFIHHPDPSVFVRHHAERLRREQSTKTAATESSDSAPAERQTMLPLVMHWIDESLLAKGSRRNALLDVLSELGNPTIAETIDEIALQLHAEAKRLERICSELQQVQQVTRAWTKAPFKKPLREVSHARMIEDQDAALVMQWGLLLGEGIDLPDPFLQSIAAWMRASVLRPRTQVALVTQLLSRWNQVRNSKQSACVLRSIERIFLGLSDCVCSSQHPHRMLTCIRQMLPQGRSTSLQVFEPWLETSQPVSRPAKPYQRTPDLTAFIQLICELDRLDELPTQSNLIRSLAEIIAGCPSVSDATQLVIAFNHTQTLVNGVTAKEIYSAQPFVEHPRALAALLWSIDSKYIDEDDLIALHPLSVSPLGRRMIERFVHDEGDRPLQRLANLASAIVESGLSVSSSPPQLANDDWIARYPERLHESLRLLAQACENSEQIARDVLAHDFVDTSKRQSEKQFLQQRLESAELDDSQRARFTRRVEAIDRLLTSELAVSDERLARLAEKIEHRALSRYEKWVIQSLSDQARVFLDLGEQPIPSDQIDRQDLQLLIARVAGLEARMRRLGVRLLKRSFAGETCPGVEEPENAAFVQRMTDLGIELSPWLDTNRTTRVEPGNAPAYALQISRDPMDYLLMGHWFKTCLAPEGFNFFSTIANAVDINKQVLYGRTDDGSVVGRCLLTLGDRGELMRYRAYAHESRYGFESAVESFVNSLATAMNTTRSTTARVSELVSPSWYDDGAVDGDRDSVACLLQQYQQLVIKHASNAVPSVDDIEAIEQSITAVLSRYDLDSLVEESQYWRDGRTNMPQPWIMQLIWKALLEQNARFRTTLRFALRAADTKHTGFLDELLTDVSPRDIITQFRRSRCGYADCYCFAGIGEISNVRAILSRIEPHLALKAMRASRKRSIRSDLAEVSHERRALLAEIHERLGRLKLPERLRGTCG